MMMAMMTVVNLLKFMAKNKMKTRFSVGLLRKKLLTDSIPNISVMTPRNIQKFSQ